MQGLAVQNKVICSYMQTQWTSLPNIQYMGIHGKLLLYMVGQFCALHGVNVTSTQQQANNKAALRTIQSCSRESFHVFMESVGLFKQERCIWNESAPLLCLE